MRVVAQALLVVPFFVAYWYVHHQLALWVMWVPELFADRACRTAGLLFGVVLCGILSALLFAGPIRILYERHTLAVALLVSLGAGAFDASLMHLDGKLQVTQLALVLDLVVFMVALPAAVLVLRRLRPNSSGKPPSLRDAA